MCAFRPMIPASGDISRGIRAHSASNCDTRAQTGIACTFAFGRSVVLEAGHVWVLGVLRVLITAERMSTSPCGFKSDPGINVERIVVGTVCADVPELATSGHVLALIDLGKFWVGKLQGKIDGNRAADRQ